MVVQDRCPQLRFGMHVFDAHEQLLGTVILVRKDRFVLRQELGLTQLVEVPLVAVAGVVGGLVLLTLTPGEIELFCRVLERKESGSTERSLLPRAVPAHTARVS